MQSHNRDTSLYWDRNMCQKPQELLEVVTSFHVDPETCCVTLTAGQNTAAAGYTLRAVLWCYRDGIVGTGPRSGVEPWEKEFSGGCTFPLGTYVPKPVSSVGHFQPVFSSWLSQLRLLNPQTLLIFISLRQSGGRTCRDSFGFQPLGVIEFAEVATPMYTSARCVKSSQNWRRWGTSDWYN